MKNKKQNTFKQSKNNNNNINNNTNDEKKKKKKNPKAIKAIIQSDNATNNCL